MSSGAVAIRVADNMKSVSQDTQFRVLRYLETAPTSTQREIAKDLGVSLGGVNYCLKVLLDEGYIKAQNFRSSNNKLRYAYVLTPSGISAKTALTGRFLKRKLAEFSALKSEIDSLRKDVSQEDV